MRFVGRGPELAALRAAADVARTGRCRIVLVTGEAGVGKSRLLEEFGRGLGDGFRYARVCCGDLGAAPLWPWRSVLTALGCTIGPALANPNLADPTLANPNLGDPTRGDVAEAGFAIRQSYTRALIDRAGEGPVAIGLDDLHRADEATLALLTHLADVAPDSPLLVVGAYRDEQPLPTPRAPAGPAISRITLRGLSAEEVAELAGEIIGTAVPAALASQLRRRTDGNPQSLAEIAHQVDPGADVSQPLVISWPEPVRSAAQTRLAALTPGCRGVLAAAAVIGREFDLALLERIATASGGDVLDALDEAGRHRLITPCAGQVYAFARAIDREILYDSHGVRERAQLHEAAARALLAFTAFVDERGPTVGELAHHLVNAAVLGGADRLDLAVAYAVAAATQASEQHRSHDAAGHHADALRLAIRAGWAAPAVGRLLVAVGEARLAAGEFAAGRDALAAAGRMGRACDDAGLLAAAALGHGPRPGHGETAAPDPDLVALLTEAVQASGADADASVLARLRARLAVELAGIPGAQAQADLATAAADECADPRAIAEACLAQAAAAPPGAPADLRPALRVAVALGDATLECRARLALAAAALSRGDLSAADRELAAVAAGSGHPFARWCAGLAAAHRALLAGDVATAELLAGQAATLGQSVAPHAAQRTHAAQLAAAGLARSRLVEVAPTLAELSRTAPQPAWLPALSAAVAIEQAEVDVARALLAEEFDDLGSPAGGALWRLALLARVAVALGDDPATQRLAALLRPHAERWIVIGPAVADAGPVALTLAWLDLARGDLRAAATALEQAARTATGTIWQAHLRLARAQWLLARHRPEDRAAALREARAARHSATAAALGGLLDQADALLGELAAGSGTGLTRREQEVAALAIRGASAREIAEHLVVGERTVETHLANIYRKLGVRSRVELITRFGGSPAQPDGHAR